ncbi:MAG TPA: hypothetical protein VLZ83_16045, partial [Edaphocola sp.]|nr:hypothetical protein [Edaphocola sp.]
PFLLLINHFIYLFIVNVSMLLLGFLPLNANGGGMASTGLRATPCQVTRKVGAGYNPSHTSETLIGYTAC